MKTFHIPTPISRRRFLRGLGVTVGIPMLECMTPVFGNTTQPEPPRRMLLISNNLGVLPQHFFPKEKGAGYTLSPYLNELAAFRGDFTVFSGLSHPAVTGGHSTENCFLTAARDPTGSGFRNSISLDQFSAEKLGQQTRFPTLNLGVNIDKANRSLSWTRDGVLLPAEDSPSALFRKMFLQGDANDMARNLKRLQERGSILDVVRDDICSFQRGLGSADQSRLDQYLTSVREAEIRARRADAWLDTPLPAISDADRKRTNRDIAATMAGDYFRTVYDLMVLAFQTDVTRVATFSLGGEGDAFAIPEIGITESRHQLSHHGGDTGYMEKLTNYDTFAIEQFSYFLSRLTETKDLNGKPLIGSTMALFGSGMSYGHSHGNANLPLVFAGGSDLGLKHGSHLDFNQEPKDFQGYALGPDGALTSAHYQLCSRPVNTDAHMSNLLLLMAHRMGVEADQFGDSNKAIEV